MPKKKLNLTSCSFLLSQSSEFVVQRHEQQIENSRQNNNNFLQNNVERISNKEELKIFLDELLCNQCKQIPFKPTICQQCQLMYCQNCIDQIQMDNQTNQQQLTQQQSNQIGSCCRLINKSRSKHIVPEAINKLLKKIKFYCKNKDLGCDCIKEYATIEDHEKNQCDFSLIACSQLDCNMFVYKKDIGKHQNQQCHYRLVNCEFCHEQLRWLILDQHYDICEFKPVECQWCSQEYFRNVINDHEEECDQREYICDQCMHKMRFCDYERHKGYQCQKKQRNYYKRKFYKQKNLKEKLEQQEQEKDTQIKLLKEQLIQMGFTHHYLNAELKSLRCEGQDRDW